MADVIETFNTPGSYTWTCPSGVHVVRARCKGPGGSSGAGANLGGLGQGGGGGAHAEDDVSVTPGTVYNFQVGGPGTAGVAPSGGGTTGDAQPGTDSWFGSSATVMAKAGQWGSGGTRSAGGAGGLASASVGAVKFSGGNGTPSGNGAGGGSAGGGGAGGNAALGTGGAAGAAPHAGVAGRTHSGGSLVGNGPGGGASAGTANNASNGALGGPGQVELEYAMTETVTEAIGMTDSISGNMHTFDPVGLLNDSIDMFWGEDQVDRVCLGSIEVWNKISPFPFVIDLAAPGEYYRFEVPEYCFELAFSSAGGRGGRSAAYGTAPQVGTAVGGAGSLQLGTLSVNPGDIIEGYVAAKGGNGYGVSGDNFGIGGEPGGGGSAMNIYGHEYDALGGTGGGCTTIWKNGVLMLVTAGGGGAGASNQGPQAGGNGGAGGGAVGQDGFNGTTNGSAAQKGFGGGGGTQSAGGAGGTGSTLSNGAGTGQNGNFLAGGSTFRRGAFGTGLNAHPCGGGGGAGYWGGGGGGNGSDPSLIHGAAGGGGGGSDFHDPTDVDIVSQVQGGNAADDGLLVIIFYAKRTYEVPV